MSKELQYYHKNKSIINQKRRLKYKLDKGLINQFQYNIELERIKNKIANTNCNEDLINHVFENLEDATYNDLVIIERRIQKLKEK